MRILVRLGDLFGAEKLIPIDSAHVSGVSYKTLGDAPIEFLRAFATQGARAKVPTTLNPQSLDQQYLRRRLPARLVEKQLDILDQYGRMGFERCLTCTPYHLRTPRRGAHLAWAESSAVVYANSVLGAWTNREGGPSALAASVVGKTPDYGMHRRENRQPNVLVEVGKPLENEVEYGALGAYLGKSLGDRIPAIQGIDGAEEDWLKQLGAALATTGMANMFCKTGSRKDRQLEKIAVEAADISGTVESLSSGANAKPDLVFIGCPHCSMSEIERVAGLVKGRKVKPDTEFWVCTSQCVKQKAGPCVEQIEASGGHVLEGVCTVVSWIEVLGIRTMVTNSVKTAYYAPTLCKAEATLAPLRDCVDAALQG